MSANPFLIIGSPIAGWALFACLLLLRVPATSAGITGVAWGVVWLAASQWGRPPRRRSPDKTGERREPSLSRRSYFNAAVASTAMTPLPTYALASLFSWVDVLPVSIGIPLFAALSVPGPLVLWWLALRPQVKADSRPIMAVGWTQYEPLSPPRPLPPRGSSATRAL